MNTHPQNALKVLQLLLRCGMVCREELNVILEMMPAVPGERTGDGEEDPGTEMPRGQEYTPQSCQKTLALEFDNRA